MNASPAGRGGGPGPAVTRWLETAPGFLFALYGGLSAFGAYFAMYAFRKPFTVAQFAAAPSLMGMSFKTVLVIAQVAGYAASKVIGVKFVSEVSPSRRALAILALIAAAEVSLVGFAVAPDLLRPVMLVLNGLALGMIWGLVFGFLEGRRLSEVLGSILCASFILSSGVVKSTGKWLLLSGLADEHWMPALTGAAYAPVLLISVAALSLLPPPSDADKRERTERLPMNAAARRALFREWAPGLAALIAVYVGLTALRDFRDNFAAEIWGALGFRSDAAIFTLSEVPVAVVVLATMAALMLLKDNRRAFVANLLLVGAGLAIAGLSSTAFELRLIGPVSWMILVGAGLYLAYTPFNALLFDRFIAATGRPGTAGFLIYVADSWGYAASVALLLARSAMGLQMSWVRFLEQISWGAALIGLSLTAWSLLYFHRTFRSLSGRNT